MRSNISIQYWFKINDDNKYFARINEITRLWDINLDNLPVMFSHHSRCSSHWGWPQGWWHVVPVTRVSFVPPGTRRSPLMVTRVVQTAASCATCWTRCGTIQLTLIDEVNLRVGTRVLEVVKVVIRVVNAIEARQTDEWVVGGWGWGRPHTKSFCVLWGCQCICQVMILV